MDHPKRGLACIFIHSKFDLKGYKIDERPGAEQDENMLTETLNKLDFQVIPFKNLKADEISQKIAERKYHSTSCRFFHYSIFSFYAYVISVRINKDLKHHDCLLIAVSSHGEDGGKIYAYDKLYDVEDLWMPFTADKCSKLAGKPKLFFIQVVLFHSKFNLDNNVLFFLKGLSRTFARWRDTCELLFNSS